MVRKSLSAVPRLFNVDKFLNNNGMGKEQEWFWKLIGKTLVKSYMVVCFAWWFNETSPLGWFEMKLRPKEEKEMAHLYERRVFPYPGDEEAMEEFVKKGGMIGTSIGPKGFIDSDKDSVNFSKMLQDRKLEQEATKLWMRMRSEVVTELQEKGFHVESEGSG